jgi:predicted amidohydrolase
MRVAAYQATLLPAGSSEPALRLIRERVDECAHRGVEILCCPEGILGGLADYAQRPHDIAIPTGGGALEAFLEPLASSTVTTIVGYTEIDGQGRLYNAAAVYHRGAVLGVYRKVYPAIRRSVYDAGDRLPVFAVGDLTFGVVICNDSNYYEPARVMASQGAVALFVPTNNGLPPERDSARLAQEARHVDIARAIDNTVAVIRADVAGRTVDLACAGASGIVDREGFVLASARPFEEALLVADIPTAPPARRRGWDAGRNPAVATAYAQLVAECAPRESAG